jgi:hypothetical protein
MNSACVPPAASETELPEFSGGTVIVVDRLIHGAGVDVAGTVAVDRCRDVGQQLGQLRLVVGAHAFARGAPFGTGAHDRDGTVSQPDRTRARCRPALTEAGAQITLLLHTTESVRQTGADGAGRRAQITRTTPERCAEPSAWTSALDGDGGPRAGGQDGCGQCG